MGTKMEGTAGMTRVSCSRLPISTLLQQWRLHICTEQPARMLNHPHTEKSFSYIQMVSSVFVCAETVKVNAQATGKLKTGRTLKKIFKYIHKKLMCKRK